MLLIISSIGQLSTSAALEWEVELELLLLCSKQLDELAVLSGSQKEVTRVTEVCSFEIVLAACIELGKDNCAAANVLVGFDGFD